MEEQQPSVVDDAIRVESRALHNGNQFQCGRFHQKIEWSPDSDFQIEVNQKHTISPNYAFHIQIRQKLDAFPIVARADPIQRNAKMSRIPERISTVEAGENAIQISPNNRISQQCAAESPLLRPSRAMLLRGMPQNVQSQCRSNQEPQEDSRSPQNGSTSAQRHLLR
jgi:hypothetical protein